jgi:hydrogenase nickel incorporation protein HypB
LAAMHDITGSFGDVLQRQLELAAQNYEFLKGKGVRAINVMGAIGSGKTELILRMAEKLRERGLRVGAIAGDVAGDDDYQRFRAAGLPALQINTGDQCHLDAHQVGHALEDFPLDKVGCSFHRKRGKPRVPRGFPSGNGYGSGGHLRHRRR